jgi:isoleucyl-tRNA synthetase
LIKFNNDKSEESIHLCDYPKSDNSKIDSLLEKRMGAVRTINSLALAQRSKAGMKVRQPLSLLQIKKGILKKNDILIELIKDEVNVKKVEISSEIADDVLLDTNLTDELIEEGFMRELVRRVQDSRKTAKLTKKDKIRVQISGTEKIETLVKEWQDFFLFESGALGVDFVKVLNEKDSNQIEFKSEKALISIEKVK